MEGDGVGNEQLGGAFAAMGVSLGSKGRDLGRE